MRKKKKKKKKKKIISNQLPSETIIIEQIIHSTGNIKKKATTFHICKLMSFKAQVDDINRFKKGNAFCQIISGRKKKQKIKKGKKNLIQEKWLDVTYTHNK